MMALVGCASQPARVGYDISDYDTFRKDCGRAQAQAAYLKSRIDEFHSYFRAHPAQLTQPYRQYYTRLKNNLWSLRSSCTVLQQ
jgi:predicted P-loop ATPase/GTPase